MKSSTYTSFTDKNGCYQIKLTLINEDEEVKEEVLFSLSPLSIVVKLGNAPNIMRIIDVPSEKVIESLLGGNININVFEPIDEEEQNRRITIQGKISSSLSLHGDTVESREVQVWLEAIGENVWGREESLKTPAFTTKSDRNGNYTLTLPTWIAIRNYEEWNTYRITVEIEGYTPIEIEIPAEEAEEKLFGQVITIPPPEPIEQGDLPPEEDVDIAVNQDNKDDFTSDSIFTFTPSYDFSNPFYNPFTLW